MTAVFEAVAAMLDIDFFRTGTVHLIRFIGISLVLSLILRVVAGILYYTNISAMILFTKPIEKKEDIKRTPSALINRCVAEYMACGENGSPLNQLDAIINKNLLRMNFLGINLKSIERFSAVLEICGVAAVVPAVLLYEETGFVILFGAVYLAYRIILLFFDGNTLRDKLFYGLNTYINREIGRFYIGDDKAGLRIFKNELHSSLMEQASILQNSINNLTQTLTDVIKASYKTMQKYIDEDLNKYDDLGEKLKAPVENFGKLYSDFNDSAKLLKSSSQKLSESVLLMNDKLQIITNSLERNTEVSSRNLENTEIVFHDLRDNLKSFNAAYGSLEAELSAVKNVQSVLDLSIHRYETSLQETVGNFGDAVGSIAEYKGKEATEALNESISKHIKQFQSDTTRLLEKMTALFEQSYEQNRSEIQTLYRIEDMLKK